MRMRGLPQSQSQWHSQTLPVRFVAVAALWVSGTVSLGAVLGSPLPIFVLTAAMLALVYAYSRFEDGTAGGGAPATHFPPFVEDDPDLPPSSFADHFVAKEFAAARRGRDVTLVMFGFSRFDDFSEREGSPAAAAAIHEFGRLLHRQTRSMNVSVRYGWRGDVFLSVLSEADGAAADVFVGRVHEAVAASRVKMPAVDAGVAMYQPHLASPEEFVDAAARALSAARAVSDSSQAIQRIRPLHGGTPGSATGGSATGIRAAASRRAKTA
jgi:diguanylate cyclase (GGDEF)-like protein